MPKEYKENLKFSLLACQQPAQHNQPSTHIGTKYIQSRETAAQEPRTKKHRKTEHLKMKMKQVVSRLSGLYRKDKGDSKGGQELCRKHRLRFWMNHKPELEVVAAPSKSLSRSPSFSEIESCFSIDDCLSSPPTYDLLQSDLEDESFLDDGCTVIYRPLGAAPESYSDTRTEDEPDPSPMTQLAYLPNTLISEVFPDSLSQELPKHFYLLESATVGKSCSTHGSLAGLLSSTDHYTALVNETVCLHAAV